ncbi:hypothetical protein Leryth_008045 [Lithospermum erythrorhizon]|nr:hypothetical protein Leryth_008045 [Lithospermum erythrorhizon]
MKKGGCRGDVSFHMVLRSRVKKQLKSIAALPEEILFNILLLLPADVLYAVMRFVCRRCYMIINDPAFVNTHSLRPSSVLLVQYYGSDARCLLVGERDTNISYIKFQFPGRLVSSCNGLTLVREGSFNSTHNGLLTHNGLFYIANPITKRMMTLPTFPPVLISMCSLISLSLSNQHYKGCS